MPLWITVDCELGKHPKMAALPNDSARYGWLLTLLEAKKQRHPGTFASANHFRLVMGRHGRFLNDYVAAKLIDRGTGGSLLVHDWQRHQWAVSKAQQRGQGVDTNETSEGQEVDVSRAVSVSVPVDVLEMEGVQGEEEPDLFAFLAQHGAFIRPESGFGIRLLGLVDRRGIEVVLEAAKAMDTGERLSDRQWVFGLEKALEAIPSPPMEELLPAEDTKSKRIYERMVQRRLEWFRSGGKWDPEWGPEPTGAAA